MHSADAEKMNPIDRYAEIVDEAQHTATISTILHMADLQDTPNREAMLELATELEKEKTTRTGKRENHQNSKQETTHD